MPSGVKDIQLLELKDTISQLNKTISTQNELISSLQKMLEERNAKDSEKDLLIANLQSQLAYLKNKVFGSTSEIRHDQLDGQLNLFGTPVGDEKPAEVIEPEVISVKGYTKERKPKATYDDKYNSVRSICKHFFTDIVGLSIKFFCVSLRHMSICRRHVAGVRGRRACVLLGRRRAAAAGERGRAGRGPGRVRRAARADSAERGEINNKRPAPLPAGKTASQRRRLCAPVLFFFLLRTACGTGAQRTKRASLFCAKSARASFSRSGTRNGSTHHVSAVPRPMGPVCLAYTAINHAVPSA